MLALAGVLAQRRYRVLSALWIYLGASIAGDVAIFVALHVLHDSVFSGTYRRIYFSSDFVITIAGYLALVRLLELAFDQSPVKLPRLRTTAMLVYSGIAVCSAIPLFQAHGSFSLMRFSFALDQNLAFLAMVLAFLLSVGLNLMRVRGVRFRRVVLAFSILYSSKAIAFILVGLFPHAIRTLMPLPGLFGFALLLFTVLSKDAAPVEARPRTIPAPVEAAA